MVSRRISKVNEHIRGLFAKQLEKELSLKPGVIITVAKADTTPDLKHAKVFLSIFPEQEESYALTAVKNHLPALQRALHAELTMKIRPKIHIVSDHTENKADEVEKILQSLFSE